MNNKYFPNNNWEKIENKIKNKDLLIEEIEKNYSNINGIMILENGYVLLEEYFNGKNIDYRGNVASCTKSILSATIGIAIDKGYINSVDDKVIDYYSDIKLGKNKIRDKVTIKDLITMTATYAHKNMGQKLGKLIHSENWIEFSLSILGLGENKKEFNYTDASAHLLSGIISKTTGITTREFANKYLCNEIGMTEIPSVNMDSFHINDILFTDKKSWLEDKQGITIGGWGLTLTLRDMAKFGLLYENFGKWDNKEIISKNWIEESTMNYSTDYGYLWWLRETNSYNSYYAYGTGGNTIVCIPELNLTIAIASEVTRDKIGDRWKLIDDFILPNLK